MPNDLALLKHRTHSLTLFFSYRKWDLEAGKSINFTDLSLP